MAEIKLEDLNDGEELNDEQMKDIYGGAGVGDQTASTDPNQAPTVPIQPADPNAPLPGQGDDSGAGGGGTGGSCQL